MRIVVCPGCGRQWNGSAYAVGQKLRCVCNFLMTVPEVAPHTLRVRHCRSCGGPRSSGEPCARCGAAPVSDSSELGPVCPFCYCQAPAASQFCPSCGQKLAPEPLDVAPGRASCPRCREVRLWRRPVAGLAIEECPSCAGMWIEEAVFEQLMKTQERKERANPRALRQAGPTRLELPSEPVSYLKCPGCGKPMNRKNYGRASGVLIDECRPHGVWLDAHELEKIARYVATGGLRYASRLEELEPTTGQPSSLGPSPRFDSTEDRVDGLTSETPLSRLLAAIIRAVVS